MRPEARECLVMRMRGDAEAARERARCCDDDSISLNPAFREYWIGVAEVAERIAAKYGAAPDCDDGNPCTKPTPAPGEDAEATALLAAREPCTEAARAPLVDALENGEDDGASGVGAENGERFCDDGKDCKEETR